MPLSIDAYSMIYDASERVRKTIAPHWSAMAKYKISWTECQTFLSTIENDLQTLSLATASSDTLLPTVHMMTVLNLVSLSLIPDDQDLPIWALDHHRINDFKMVIKTVAGTKAFSWNTPLPRNQYGALPDPYDIPLLDEEDVAPPVVPQPTPSIPGPSHTNTSSSSTILDPSDDSRQKSVDRQIADKASTAPAPPKPRMKTKTTTAWPSNLQGEPSVVIYRKPVQQPVVETPREPTLKPLEDKPDEDKSREDAAAPDDPLALRRTPRAAARTKEALDIQVNNSRKRPREPSSEVDGETMIEALLVRALTLLYPKVSALFAVSLPGVGNLVFKTTLVADVFVVSSVGTPVAAKQPVVHQPKPKLSEPQLKKPKPQEPVAERKREQLKSSSSSRPEELSPKEEQPYSATAWWYLYGHPLGWRGKNVWPPQNGLTPKPTRTCMAHPVKGSIIAPQSIEIYGQASGGRFRRDSFLNYVCAVYAVYIRWTKTCQKHRCHRLF
ncbi:hypothetical protein K435DRAFT_804440 [Dendrothele bispora CBS 962.96]|uniref:Uncharacterized protein n=1 Tax=Dendrothele bispora (strain CBS 962.96) TaxID=1314807 RepID=A0A4S8LEE8_DENBC|nr:hypothetical protein K435DRAFT_804440 [Dendrothele bispora CBS 962.96]